MNYPLIFEASKPGRGSHPVSANGVPAGSALPAEFSRKEPAPLPEVSEVELVRHYTGLSRRNFGVDLGFYPLGSCTMKYNPKINEDLAGLPGFTRIHPLQPEDSVRGTLGLMHSLTAMLCDITGMDTGTLQPFAGAHGEYTGMKFFRSYFNSRGESKRTKVIVPDSSHGTNPASAHIAGFEVVELPSGPDGQVDLEMLKEHCDDTLAGIMLTNPNTLGLFETKIADIAKAVHQAGGLLYYDGANLNAIMGKCRPGDMGFDVVHLNLHKTFSTPHGGGGPGAGPVLVKDKLREFLPSPVIVKDGDGFRFSKNEELPATMGRIAGFYGNIAVLVKAYAYILTMGASGLEKASEYAVLNANYLKERLKKVLHLKYPGLCKHEFVLSAKHTKERFGISAIDIAKGLIENNIHPPTVYFPLIVPEALMIEPTETETPETLDRFCEVMELILRDAEENPDKLHAAPRNTPVSRVDEVLAARKPVVRWKEEPAEE